MAQPRFAALYKRTLPMPSRSSTSTNPARSCGIRTGTWSPWTASSAAVGFGGAYFGTHAERMRYAQFRRKGLIVGSVVT